MSDDSQGKAPKVLKAERISVKAFTEERPELHRDVVGILNRVHRDDRKTRTEWNEVLKTFGGE